MPLIGEQQIYLAMLSFAFRRRPLRVPHLFKAIGRVLLKIIIFISNDPRYLVLYPICKQQQKNI